MKRKKIILSGNIFYFELENKIDEKHRFCSRKQGDDRGNKGKKGII